MPMNYATGVHHDNGLVYRVPVGEGIYLQPYDPNQHKPNTFSHQFPQWCSQGGRDTCHNKPLFSVNSWAYNVSACQVHVFGAIAAAGAWIKFRSE